MLGLAGHPSLEGGEVGGDAIDMEVNKGTGDGVEVFTVENPHWMMFVLKASNLEFDSE
mgnify:CR=1 FL=1